MRRKKLHKRARLRNAAAGQCARNCRVIIHIRALVCIASDAFPQPAAILPHTKLSVKGKRMPTRL